MGTIFLVLNFSRLLVSFASLAEIGRPGPIQKSRDNADAVCVINEVTNYICSIGLG